MEVIIKVYAKEDEYFILNGTNISKVYTKDKEYDVIIKYILDNHIIILKIVMMNFQGMNSI